MPIIGPREDVARSLPSPAAAAALALPAGSSSLADLALDRHRPGSFDELRDGVSGLVQLLVALLLVHEILPLEARCELILDLLLSIRKGHMLNTVSQVGKIHSGKFFLLQPEPGADCLHGFRVE